MLSLTAPSGDYLQDVPQEFANLLQQEFRKDWRFINPSHDDLENELWKASEGAKRSGLTMIVLVPARTDSGWWHDYAMQGEIRFIRGRLNFGKNRLPAALIIFRPPGSAPAAAPDPDQGDISDVKKWETFKRIRVGRKCYGCGRWIEIGSTCHRGSKSVAGNIVKVRICTSCYEGKVTTCSTE